MKPKFKNSILYFLVILNILYLTSCATEQIIIAKDVNIPSIELGNRIPLKAGLYFSQEFSNAKYSIHARQYFGGTVSAGDALRYGSETIIRNVFQETLLLDPLDSAPGPDG